MRTDLSIESFSFADSTAIVEHGGAPIINPAVMYILSLNTEQSRARMTSLLNRFAKMFGYPSLQEFPWMNLRVAHMTAIKARLQQQGRAPATINLILCALRGVARQAWNEQLLSDHDKDVIKSTPGVHGERLGKGRSLSASETAQLIRNCLDSVSVAGKRDAAIISLGLGTGLRRNEIAHLRLDGINYPDRSLRIIGKGNKERKVFPPELAWESLVDWIGVRGKEGCPFVFTVIHRSSKIQIDHSLSTMAVWKIIRKRGEELGLDHFTPHDLRRTFATRMLDLGADLDTIREAMGHNSVQTTQRYVKNAEERVRRYATRMTI